MLHEQLWLNDGAATMSTSGMGVVLPGLPQQCSQTQWGCLLGWSERSHLVESPVEYHFLGSIHDINRALQC